MSVALMILFAASIAGALGMAIYGLRVLVGRWEQPRRSASRMPSVPESSGVRPIQSSLPPQASWSTQQVWIPPTGFVPPRMIAPVGIATPPPMIVPVAELGPVIGGAGRPAPMPRPASVMAVPPGPALSPRPATIPPPPMRPVARGSIPPELALDEMDSESDTSPGVPELPQPEVQRGPRFSVIKSSRR
jgi:hypothetical protein